MGRLDITESLHRALNSAGCKDSDVHFLLDWLGDDIERERHTWWATAVGALLFGCATGALLCVFRW
jgi:hypothetical protein